MDSLVEEVDLFDHYETLPEEVQKIISSFDENAELYSECERLLLELKPHGYTFDYGLCGEPFGLRKI